MPVPISLCKRGGQPGFIATRALGELKDRRAVEPLIEALANAKDPSTPRHSLETIVPDAPKRMNADDSKKWWAENKDKPAR